jgi:hypothetical protein
MVAGMILALRIPPWSRVVVAVLVIASVLGCLAWSTTTPREHSAGFQPTTATPWCPRDVRLCRRHRMGHAQSSVRCRVGRADSMSPWFQLW